MKVRSRVPSGFSLFCVPPSPGLCSFVSAVSSVFCSFAAVGVPGMLAGRALAAQGATGHQGDIVHLVLGAWPGRQSRPPRPVCSHVPRSP